MDWFLGGDSQEGKGWIWETLWGNSDDKPSVTESTQTVEPIKEESKSWSLWGS